MVGQTSVCTGLHSKRRYAANGAESVWHASCDPGPRIELAARLDDRLIGRASVHLPSKTCYLCEEFQAPCRVRDN
jgi:hypothetical protein